MRFFSNEIPLFLLAGLVIAVLGGLTPPLESSSGVALALQFVLLLATIIWGAFRVVHHAEAVAHEVGEPAGTLVLTLSVIGIEVALVVALMLGGQADPTAARDTMLAVVMLAINLVLGLALLLGAVRHGASAHNLQGSTAYLGTLIVLAGLSLVWPRIADSAPGGQVSPLQAPFLVAVSLVCYGVFLAIQVGRARGWFQDDVASTALLDAAADVREHDILSPEGGWRGGLFGRVALLLTYLALIILLAEQMAHVLEGVVAELALPRAVSGLIVAAVILAPEAMATVQAATDRQMQRAVNLSLGSALSTIGLTVPAVLLVSMVTGLPVELGLPATEILLLALSFLLAINTLATGRTNQLHGVLHLALFVAFVVLIFDGV
jgi:Ca2+:H+ antiporter